MFKKIKRCLELQRLICLEVLETLATICLYLDYDGHHLRNPYSKHMKDHFVELKTYSEQIKNNIKR